MFGLFGPSRADNEIADIINMMFGSYHRIYERHGADFLLSVIKQNELTTAFDDKGNYFVNFTVGRELIDFDFMTNLSKDRGEPLSVQVMGHGPFRGFHASVGLKDGKMLIHDDPTGAKSTRRAKELARILCKRHGAVDLS